MSIPKLEVYSKAEIIDAIRYKTKFDFALEAALVSIIQQRKHDAVFQEWELAQKRSPEALRAFANYNTELREKHGGTYKLSDLKKEELDKLVSLASKDQELDKVEQQAYEKLKSVYALWQV